jgi:hypothetical protein
MFKPSRLSLMIVFMLVLGGSVTVAQGPTGEPDVIPAPDAVLAEPLPLHPTAPLEDPTLLVGEANYSFAHGGGFLYWEKDCINSVEAGPVYIRRWAENGGMIQTLYEVTSATHDQCESVSKYNIADDDGFFYVNHNQSRLEAQLTDDPTTAIPLASLDYLDPALASDENYVYYKSPRASIAPARTRWAG